MTFKANPARLTASHFNCKHAHELLVDLLHLGQPATQREFRGSTDSSSTKEHIIWLHLRRYNMLHHSRFSCTSVHLIHPSPNHEGHSTSELPSRIFRPMQKKIACSLKMTHQISHTSELMLTCSTAEIPVLLSLECPCAGHWNPLAQQVQLKQGLESSVGLNNM